MARCALVLLKTPCSFSDAIRCAEQPEFGVGRAHFPMTAMRFLAVLLICISSLPAQTPSRSESGQAPAAGDSLRIERLTILADL
jgi:hypothetical protein